MIILRSQREIEKIKESCRICRKILEELIDIAKPGITTQEIDNIAVAAMKRYGVESASLGYRGYPGNLCVSINEEVVHGIPGKRVLIDGDIASIDICVHKEGYYGDCARTVPVGTVDGERKGLLDIGKRALDAGIEKAIPDNRIGDISHAIQSTTENAGCSVVRDYTGHGIGTSMHEEPKIPNHGSPNSGPRIRSGMVFAIEVMINSGTWDVKVLEDDWTVVTADDKPSVHFENTVVITKDGNEVLTCLKKKQ